MTDRRTALAYWMAVAAATMAAPLMQQVAETAAEAVSDVAIRTSSAQARPAFGEDAPLRPSLSPASETAASFGGEPDLRAAPASRP